MRGAGKCRGHVCRSVEGASCACARIASPSAGGNLAVTRVGADATLRRMQRDAHRRRALAACVLLVVLTSARAQSTVPEEAADAEPGQARWEAGIVVGGGRLADYPGADQSHTRGL